MGQWGVGKTFAWNQYLRSAISANEVGLKRYSYVSLFGQNSLEALKYAIFENTLPISQVETGPSLDTLNERVSFLEKNWRKALGFIGLLPQVESYLPAVARGLFLTVRDQIICIDDLERAGDELPVKDVMGLVSFLKEQRKCKVVLLLNDEELQSEAATDFRTQLEKVSDVEMRFEPTSKEAAEIGVDQSVSFRESFVKTSENLGIINIRVLRKTLRLTKRLEELLQGHDKRILEAAVPSMVLFGWVVYQPKLAPSIDFIKDFNPFSHVLNKQAPESEESKKWRPVLAAINFTNFDELDLLLLESVEAGYFDPEKLEKMAIECDKKWTASDQDNSFSAAWDKYHGSFSCNQDEVLDAMFSAAKSGAKAISPSNLDSTLGLFRKFGRDAQADEIIAHYIKERGDEKRDFYDPSRSAFLNLHDAKFKKAFEDKLVSYKDSRLPEDILWDIAKNSGWNPEDIQTLASISVDEYFAMFKKLTADKLRVTTSQALKFRRYGNTDPQQQEVSARAEEALKRIAAECEINKMRVASYGVTVDETPQEHPPAEEVR